MIKGLNDVIEYIEENLRERIQFETLVRISGMSANQLKMVFLTLSGMTIGEYIKYRRLTCATKDILNGKRITDVAYEYCYDSLDGFTRAYKLWSGFLPSQAKKEVIITTTPKLSFKIQIEGGNTMQYKFIEMPAFKFAGVSKRLSHQFEGVNMDIVALAQSITEAQRDEIRRVKNMAPNQILNISWDSDTNFMEDNGEITHMIGVITSETHISGILDVKEVESHTWAVFHCDGKFPEAMQTLNADVYAKWLPSSNYELVDAPTFSFTIDSEINPNYKYTEIYVAVRTVK